MRDAHRMKEKFDLSLDNRQIGSLLIAGIVVMGSVFVLGVVVGKKLAYSEEVAAAPDILTALDARAAALDEVRDASLTFPDELTRKTPTAPEPPPAPVAEAAAPAAAPEKPKPAPAKPAASEPALAAAPPAGNVEATATATRIKDAGAAPQTTTPRPPTGTSEDGAFTLQLSASQSRADADRFAARLRDRGYAPYIVEAQVAGKGTWYRVRMGSFASKDAASRYLKDFRRETRLDAFVAAK